MLVFGCRGGNEYGGDGDNKRADQEFSRGRAADPYDAAVSAQPRCAAATAPIDKSGTEGSNPLSSSSQSVSAVNPEAVSEKPRTLAAVCGWLGT